MPKDVKTPFRGSNYNGQAIPFDLQCPQGHITSFSGRYDWWSLTGIGPVECSSGTKSDLTFPGDWGTEGEAVHEEFPEGIQSVLVWVDDWVYTLYFNPGFDDERTLRCPPGMLASGMYGHTLNGRVLSLGLYCRPGKDSQKVKASMQSNFCPALWCL
jgi:hypothetical protein